MAPKRHPGSAGQRKSTAKSTSATLRRKRKVEDVAADETAESSKRSHKRQKDHQPLKNDVPTQLLDVYVCGTNCYGELGLGDLTKKSEILRPVLNDKLAADSVGIVQVAVGGVHSAALTHDNQILTWGVNDEGTLARDTKQEKKEDAGAANNDNGEADSEDSDEDEITLNLKEATPASVDSSLFSNGTVFAELAASDSATFALTADGQVYGWGTFRGANGVIGFSPENKKEQRTPILIPGLKDVVKIVAGAQHILALTSKNTVLSWGCDEQNQLGRRRTSRHRQTHHLIPDQCALPPNICDIGVGVYHSFAVHKNGAVYAWGSNNFGQTAVPMSAGQSNAIVAFPTESRSFRKHAKLGSITGGKDHSIALTETGQCLIWGRIDNKALGMGPEDMPSADIIHDEYDRSRILKHPAILNGISGHIVSVTAASDHTIAITESGQGYSWGFNAQSQVGQPGLDEVERPTLLQSKSVNGKKLLAAAAGGQFSIVVGEHPETTQ